MTSSVLSHPSNSIPILVCAPYIQTNYSPQLNPTITLANANSWTNIDPVQLRPNVLASERLEKWLPAIIPRSSLPSELLNKQTQLALKAFAPSTKSTYGTGLLKYHSYCDTIALPEIYRAPCTTTILAGFITFLSGQYSKTAINNFLAGVKAWHTIHFIPLEIDERIINNLMRGASKIQPLPLPKREPVTTEYLAKIIEFLDVTKPEQAAVAACLTTTFYSCSRLGEFTVPAIKLFDPRRHITISGISFQHDKFFNKVTAFRLPSTKVSDAGETVFWAPQSGKTDPQFFLLKHLELNEPGPHEHLFTFKTYNKRLPLTRNIFLRNIKIAAQKAQIPYLSGHSLRIGATLEYLLRGIPFEVVKHIGRWNSNAFTLYLREHGRILAPYLQQKPQVNNEFLEYSNIILR